ncbi:aspartate-semialdehyde dehydrogenase [Thermosipho melanesiensis]|uniref:Aspartate-semialdehyde dehydrogenase n=2 Tax=Thermosipho melanesiensis TaxID=46541 RepID=A6LP56_THEM4|nr:aspartate-semialdehyde dehydrogenase [Thermosipho melanesiensis]ABR31707.1 aspartate-semialdehyde dehydrogenase [Thermosipho melanesiensis BI429]APT74730.1 aspartate-semialdehyde dehydrogenase [Thermosipho melanesiensis]OOC35231.1 aspartate-semialdehyde dehydrogenase [Thermosipho melanesiensis]OOC35441.1 aspartate-semialdehyde dehydrogenase [Thermosipho melanesiensis]OOC36692.1 aspartate-semialdehyde dehydrogenase [Thermosipho melanesiensis]
MKIGIVGATGEVGRAMIKVLEKFNIPVKELRLFASKNSKGKYLKFKGQEIMVEELTEDTMKEKYDFLLFSAGKNISKHFAPIAAKYGNTIIDNSSAFRMEKDIPLIVPEINGYLVKSYKGIIANPNCSTIQMVLSLHKIHEKLKIKEIYVSTYQAVSGAGHKAIEEFSEQLNGNKINAIFPKQIAYNIIPVIGNILSNNFSEEEYKMINETKKILNDYSIKVYPTTVRVPVIYGHSEAIVVRTKKSSSLNELKELISKSKNVIYTEEIITPLDVEDKDEVFVTRLRQFDTNTFSIWNVADNIRVGAATNAVRILEVMINE